MATNDETAPPGGSDASELGARAVRGASWTIGMGLASRAVGLVGTLVITHYLSPDIIGQTSNASILIVIAHQISTLGITQYIVARPDAPREVTWHVSLLYLSAGFLAIGAMGIFGGHLSGVLESPDLARYLPGLALSVMIDRAIFIPERLLVRKIQFRTMSVWRAFADLLYSATSIALAMRGLGGYAIVFANLARSTFYAFGILRATHFKEWLSPSRFDTKIVRKLFSFGLPLWIGTSASAMARRWDNLLISSMFGVSTVGAYNLAYNLAELPAGYIGNQIGDVLMPAFARMDEAQRRVAIVKSTGVLAIVVFPLALGLGAIAPTLVVLFLGLQWASVAPMLMILSGLAISSPIGWTIAAYFQTLGRTSAVLFLEVFKVVALLSLMAVLGHFGGPLWACAAVPLAFLAYAISSLWMVHRVDNVSFAALIGVCVPPFLACAPMVGAIYAMRSGWVRAGLGLLPLRLVLELVLGGVVYVGSAFVVARPAAQEFVRYGKQFLARRRGRA